MEQRRGQACIVLRLDRGGHHPDYVTNEQAIAGRELEIIEHQLIQRGFHSRIATKTHVLNPLHRLIDGKSTDGPDIETPQALTLLRELKANVERYDGVRVRTVGGRHAS